MPIPETPKRAIQPSDAPQSRRRRPAQFWLAIGLAVVIVVGGGTAAVFALISPSTTIVAPPQLPVPLPVFESELVCEPMPAMRSWPLTGQPGMTADHPALAVKVENSEEARPQVGLDAADLVFEELVEGGITRYVAIFHSTMPPLVLPVRSIRPMDGPIACWTGGLMVYSGGQAPFQWRASQCGLQLTEESEGDGSFERVDDRWAPHDLAGVPEGLLARADAEHQAPPPGFADFVTHDSTAQALGQPTAEVAVEISYIATPNWAWDASAQRWLRSEGDEPAVVESGARLSATNVLVLSVDVISTAYSDVGGASVPETIVVGEGVGLVASGGMSAPITWRKDSETAPWQFFDANGAPVNLLVGNTWIELVPTDGSWEVK